MSTASIIIAIAIVAIATVFFLVRRSTNSAPSLAPTSPKPVLRDVSASQPNETPPSEPPKTPVLAANSQTTALDPPDPQIAAAIQAASGDEAPLQELPKVSTRSGRPSWPAPAAGDDVSALRKGLGATRGGFVARLASLFRSKPKVDASTLADIEEVLLTADIGTRTTQSLMTALSKRIGDGAATSDVWEILSAEARSILEVDAKPVSFGIRPTVILVVGVNGVGKTTTIGKLASRFMHEGKSVLLAAGDTFRAAAVLQLDVWGRKVGCPVVRGKENADPSSVIFEAIKQAIRDDIDVVIADTAGRLHTKAPLMDELTKVHRTIEKALDGRPADEVFLVLDSTNGQNALQQAQLFREALPVSGLVLTKLDGSAKGGVVLGIVSEQKLPVRYIGIGERVEDLRDFNGAAFVEALFSPTEGDAAA
jgi:fused signal recognition particle receptor